MTIILMETIVLFFRNEYIGLETYSPKSELTWQTIRWDSESVLVLLVSALGKTPEGDFCFLCINPQIS